MQRVFLQSSMQMFGGLLHTARAFVLISLLVVAAASSFAAPPTKLGDLNADGVLDVFDLTVLRQHIRQVTPIAENLKPFADVNGDGFLNEDDAVALINIIVGRDPAKILPLASIRETSPFAGEGGVALTREVVLRFTMPLSVNASLTTWDANTQTPGDLYAEAGGRKLLTRVELSGDRTKATLFFLEPVPASTRVTITFDGVGINDLLERQIDPVGDNLATGGIFTFTYDTAPITPVPGTGIIGHVYASEKGAGGANVPLEHVLVRVVGSETLFTFTAADGSFSLNPCPAGRFFVEVDGRESGGRHFYDNPPGAYYPYINKPWEALPGRADNLAAGTGVIYLPLIPAGTLQPVSPMVETVVKFAPSVVAANPALAGVEITVPPNSLFADDGTRGGRVGLAPVASDRLPEPLPPGLNHALDISIQTDGATNFDRPVPVKFPNLPDPVTGVKLKPGEKSALWSYNHDKGAWEIAGPMTVTDDGNFLVTDVGVGVRQPGWHGAMPGFQIDPTPPKICAQPSSPAGPNSPAAAALACCGGAIPTTARAAGETMAPCPPDDACKNPPPSDLGSPFESLYRAQFRCLHDKVCQRYPTVPGQRKPFARHVFDQLSTMGYPSMDVVCEPSTNFGDIGVVLCFTRIGAGYHIKHELYPIFNEYAEQIVKQGGDIGAAFDQWDQEHDDFLDNVVSPCFDELFPDALTARAVDASTRATVVGLREQAQARARLLQLVQQFRINAAQAANVSETPSQITERVSSPFENTLPLKVRGSLNREVAVGSDTVFRVTKASSGGGEVDISQPSQGTRYFLGVPPKIATVSSEGVLHVSVASEPLMSVPTTIKVFAVNGGKFGFYSVSVKDVDADNDGLCDSWEISVGLNPTVPNNELSDVDGDGLTDVQEGLYGTSPTNPDTDGDGILDGVEVRLKTGVLKPSVGTNASSTTVFFAVVENVATGQVFRMHGTIESMFRTVVVAPDSHFRLWLYNPTTNKIGYSDFQTQAGAGRMAAPTIILLDSGGIDTDNDGLSDKAEFVIGTNPNSVDTDLDGVSDFVEIQQNSDPLDNLPARTGVFSTIDTPGQAKDIAAQNTVALLADGSEGVSVFNVANALNPVRTAQVRLTGSTEAVALDGTLAAATGSSLSLLDLSDLSAVRVTKQLFLGGTPRAVTAAGGVAYAGLDNGQVVAVDLAAGAELERLQVSTEPIHDLSFAGDVLYARSASRVLAIEFAPAGMTVAGSVAVPGSSAARQRLFAGVGLAYAPFDQGYAILSLADPLHPTVTGAISVAQRGWRQFVPTGSGLGLSIFTNNIGPADVHLYDIGANGTGSQFLTTFTTPGDAQAVSIFNGLAYVADGDAGLTVVNYKAYDALGVPPTISIGTGFPTVSGALQAEEGKLGRVTAQVADDVQVRNVEFYVDGQLAVTDGNFPFEHRFTTPLKFQVGFTKPSFTLRAKATDTGGNSTWSETLTVTLVADATPPRVVKFLPPTGSFTGSIRAIAATFSEPIDQATLTATSIAITGAGPDGVFGSADDLTPTGGAISYREASNAAFVTFPQDLAPSLYRLVVSPPIADLAGNQLAAPAQTQFRVFSFTDSDGDGIPDDVEPLLGLNPNNPDTDGDGIRDGDEDFDNDRLTNAQEIALGLDPRNAYSNGTGTLDGDADPDGDRLTNRREALAGTDANKADTDNDGWNDETEVTGGSNPLDPKSVPIGLIASLPPVSIVRVGDLTTGLLVNASVIAQPTVFLARTFSDPNSPNGGLGAAAFIATPTVYVARYDQPAGSSNWLSGAIQAQPSVTVTRPNSDPNGPNGGLGGASFIATPGVIMLRLDISGLFISQPPVTVEIQNP